MKTRDLCFQTIAWWKGIVKVISSGALLVKIGPVFNNKGTKFRYFDNLNGKICHSKSFSPKKIHTLKISHRRQKVTITLSPAQTWRACLWALFAIMHTVCDWQEHWSRVAPTVSEAQTCTNVLVRKEEGKCLQVISKLFKNALDHCRQSPSENINVSACANCNLHKYACEENTDKKSAVNQ